MTTQDKLAQALRDMVEASQGKFGDLVFMAKASQDAAEALAEHEAQVQAAPENHFAGVSNMVPDGYRLVPVDPTDAMRIAGGIALESSPAHDVIGPLVDAWAAMLAAAPQPEAVTQAELSQVLVEHRERLDAKGDDIDGLLIRFERHAQRYGELWERCQGKGWPAKESEEFSAIRDEKLPELKKQIRAALTAQQAEREPLTDADRVDAERYRWIRSVGGKSWTVLETNQPAVDELYDAATDAARSVERAHGIGKDQS